MVDHQEAYRVNLVEEVGKLCRAVKGAPGKRNREATLAALRTNMTELVRVCTEGKHRALTTLKEKHETFPVDNALVTTEILSEVAIAADAVLKA